MDLMPLKQQLADAIQMMERARLLDFNGHMSVRVPDTEYMMINTRKSSRASVTVGDLVIIDMDGRLVEGSDEAPSEYYIHTEIYRRRPEVQSISHIHPQWSTLFSITQIPLRPVIIQGAVLGDVRIFQKPNLINTKELGEELAVALGQDCAILMKAHGAVVAGQSVVETFVLSYYLEENAYRQYMAAQLGYAHSLTEDEVKEMASSVWQPKIIQKVWNNHFSKLERAYR